MLEKARGIKAIFFDVDGTLYDHTNHDFTESTKQTLRQLADRGYQLYVATSRSEQELEHVWDLIGQFSFAGIISSGGALTRLGMDIVDVRYMDQGDATRLMEYCRSCGIDVRWQSLDRCCFDAQPDACSAEVFSSLYQMVPKTQKWNGEPLLNVICYANERQAKELASLLRYAEFVRYQGAIEVTGQYVNKASAIARLVKQIGLSMDEVAAFGDGENDVLMLASVGIGVAMGNACKEAKAVADLVSEVIAENGIAIAAQALGLVEEGVSV